jgi:hypothetical protein
MSGAPNDGGAAFPEPAVFDVARGEVNPATAYGFAAGMTLREYFAAKAPFTLADAVMAADLEVASVSVEVAECRVLHDPGKRRIAMETLAALRWEYADAMLKVRGGAA